MNYIKLRKLYLKSLLIPIFFTKIAKNIVAYYFI